MAEASAAPTTGAASCRTRRMTARHYVRGGPSVPAEVLQALDEDRLVFFCGAGISMATGLPDFRRLVLDVFAACHAPLEGDPAAKGAFDDHQYDKVLEILESKEGEQRGSMRRAVKRRLIKPPEGDTDLLLHKALLTLAERKGRPGERTGYRLVTTNFDDRFERADLVPFWIEQGPGLRRPRPDALRKVTYLHGRIEHELPEDDQELPDLVLTSADFGNAYLHDGWAARFVVELFREFTVLFVGYGLNDPVMRYLVDAFASERRSGGRFRPAFALASYRQAEDGDRERQEGLWRARNVVPVLYAADHPGKHPHALLSETIVAWAEEHAAGLAGRLEKALSIARRPYQPKLSDSAEFDEVAILAWALPQGEGAVAKWFADADPAPDIAWLRPVLARRVLDPARPGYVCELLDIDNVRPALADWICRSLGRLETVRWVIERRGQLFHEFARQLAWHLLRFVDALPPEPFARFWRATLASWEARRDVPIFFHVGLLKVEDDRFTLDSRRLLLDFLRPRLVGPSRPFGTGESTKFPENLEDLAHFGLELGEQHATATVRSVLDALQKRTGVDFYRRLLASIVDDLTSLLFEALDLSSLADISPSCNRSHTTRQWLTRSDPMGDLESWEGLLDILLESWRATCTVSPDSAQVLAGRWWNSWRNVGHGLCLRLALLTAADLEAVAIWPLLSALMQEPKGLWELEWKAELQRLLRMRARSLGPGELQSLCSRMLDGPPRSMYRPDTDEETLARVKQRMIDELLTALARSGAELPGDLSTTAEEALARVEALRAAWQADGYDVGEDGVPLWGTTGVGTILPPSAAHLKERSAREIACAVREYRDRWGRDDRASSLLADAVRQQPARAAEIGEALLAEGEERSPIWSEYWSALRMLDPGVDLLDQLARLAGVAGHDHALSGNAFPSLCSWIARLAEVEGLNQAAEGSFWQLWDRAATRALAETGADGKEPSLDTAVGDPAGMLAQALLSRLHAASFRPGGSGLPPLIAERCSLLADDPSPTGRFARIIFAGNLAWFHRTDPTWTRRHLLERMVWGGSDQRDTIGLWRGYLRSPHCTPHLLDAFKPLLLETLRHGNELDERSFGSLCRLVVEISFQEPDAFSPMEIDAAIGAIGAAGIVEAANAIQHVLLGAADPAGLWRSRSAPWIERYWPDAPAFLGVEPAGAANRLLLATREAFPDALRLLVRKRLVGLLPKAAWAAAVREIVSRVILPEEKHEAFDYAATFPAEVVDWLGRITAPGALAPWHKDSLRKVLERLRRLAPDVAGTQVFRFLEDASR